MSTMKIHKTETLMGGHRKQKNWIRSEEKVKNWRKVSKRQTERCSSQRHGAATGSERKSDITRSGRLSDGTTNSNSTVSSSESPMKRLEDVDDLDQKQSIEKCLQWMETLPEKFSGMHILVQPSLYDAGEVS